METIAAIIQTMNIAMMAYLLRRADQADNNLHEHERKKHP
jgi:hypothetical protein